MTKKAAKKTDELEDRWIVARAAYDQANSLAVQAVNKYVEVGLHLVGLREQYPGDLEFGRARAHYMPDMSKSWASRLMKVARDPRLHTKELEKLSISHLVELSSKDDDHVARVEEAVSEGSVPSVRSLRDGPEPGPATPIATPDSAPEDDPPEPAGRGPEDPGETPDGQKRAGWAKDGARELTQEDMIADILQRPVEERIRWVEENPLGSPDYWIVLGLNPFFDILPHMDLVEVVADYWKDGTDSELYEWIDWALHLALKEYEI